MSRSLSDNLMNQLFGSTSDDPFLSLITLSHDSFATIRLVNNSEDITSNGELFSAFPFKITLPTDDGETARELKLIIDNVTLELINELRAVTTPISLKVEMVLASNPDFIEIDYTDLKLRNVTINAQSVSGSIVMDDFLNTGMTSEQYAPSNFPGLFG